MATASEAVRKLSYKVDSDDAVRRIGGVTAAQKGVTAALKEGSAASEANEARSAKLQSRYADLMKQQQAYQAMLIRQADAMTAANDNYAESTSHLTEAIRAGAKAALDYAAGWAATAGAVGAAVLIFRSALAIFGQLYLAYKAATVIIGLYVEAWQLAGKQLEEYRQIAEKAAAVDVSTDFYQKLIKGAEAAKTPVDELTKSLQNFQKASADQLGGSVLQQRLDQHLKAGNFAGNSGVGMLGQANTAEEKYKAVAVIIREAMQAGQRLAALDLAKTAFGPEISDRLRSDSEYLDNILASAQKVKDTEIVSEQQIGRAIEMQSRYEAAVKILETRWHPIQNLLTQLGVKMHEIWVGIVETIASAVDWVAKLAIAVADALGPYLKYLQMAQNIVSRASAAAAPAFGPAGVAVGVIGAGVTAATNQEVTATDDLTKAYDKLRAGLQNTNAVQQAVAQSNAVQAAVWRDTSKTVAGAQSEVKDQFDRAREAIEKHTARMEADRQAVGLGAGALEEFRARAQLTTAALQSGLDPAASDVAAKIDELAKRAREAGDALARARLDDQINFGRNTSLLSSQDVQIAQQLRNIYPDVSQALASTEAQALRVNNAFREIAQTLENTLVSNLTDIGMGTKSVAQGATDMGVAFARAVEQMVVKIMIVEPLLRSLQQSIGGMGGLFSFGASPQAAAVAAGTAPAMHTGGIVGSEPTFNRYIHPAYFDDAPRFHTGGIAGNEVPIIAQRGEGVFTQGQMRALGAGASPKVNVIVNNNNGSSVAVGEARSNADGGIDIPVLIDAANAKNIANPGSATRRMLDMPRVGRR